MVTIRESVSAVANRWIRGPSRLVVAGLLGLATVVGAIDVSDAMSRSSPELAACDRFAAVMADERYDLVDAYGNLDEASAYSLGTAVEDELTAVRTAAGATRSGNGALVDVISATRRFESACRDTGWVD